MATAPRPSGTTPGTAAPDRTTTAAEPGLVQQRAPAYGTDYPLILDPRRPLQDSPRRGRVLAVADRAHHVGLRRPQPDRVRHRDDGRVRHCRVAQQYVLQLSRRDPAVDGLEHVVGPRQIGEAAVRTAHREVTGAVAAVGEDPRRAPLVADVSAHQAERPLRRLQLQADLARFTVHDGTSGPGVDQGHRVAGQREPHAAGDRGAARRVADLAGRLGLPITVAQVDAPGAGDLFDQRRFQWLVGGGGLPQRGRSPAQAQRPDNTTRSYASEWKTWTAFCEQMGVPSTAATRGTLRAFVDFLWHREKRAYAPPSTASSPASRSPCARNTASPSILKPPSPHGSCSRITGVQPGRTRSPSAAAAKHRPCGSRPFA